MRFLRAIAVCALMGETGMAQMPRQPDVEAQRAAMRMLSFLEGTWSGEGRMWQGAAPTEFRQTEEARLKLDGLVLVIEGRGESKADGKPLIRALGFVSYDDAAGVYRFRAFNEGRYAETELKLAADGRGAEWGFAAGNIRSRSVLRIDAEGAWTESHELTLGDQPPRKWMELKVRRAGR